MPFNDYWTPGLPEGPVGILLGLAMVAAGVL